MIKRNKARSNFLSESYNSKERFISYWHQINEIIKLKPESILEIGVGNMFVSKYLKDREYNIVTLDIKEGLESDVIGNVLNMPFDDNSFDIVSCCEVLEHLPYQDFRTALLEIFRVSKSHAVLSLPDATRNVCFFIKVPKIREPLRIFLNIPKLMKRLHTFDGAHYWEIGKRDFSLNKIICDIKKTGFTVEKTYRIFEYPYHRFFLLNK